MTLNLSFLDESMSKLCRKYSFYRYPKTKSLRTRISLRWRIFSNDLVKQTQQLFEITGTLSDHLSPWYVRYAVAEIWLYSLQSFARRYPTFTYESLCPGKKQSDPGIYLKNLACMCFYVENETITIQ